MLADGTPLPRNASAHRLVCDAQSAKARLQWSSSLESTINSALSVAGEQGSSEISPASARMLAWILSPRMFKRLSRKVCDSLTGITIRFDLAADVSTIAVLIVCTRSSLRRPAKAPVESESLRRVLILEETWAEVRQLITEFLASSGDQCRPDALRCPSMFKVAYGLREPVLSGSALG
jgi:hypothetical protein